MSTEIVEIENPSRRRLYRYFTAISKLRLGILTEQGGGSQELVPFLGRRPFFLSLFKFQLTCKFKLFVSSLLWARLPSHQPPRGLRDRPPAPPPALTRRRPES